MTPALQHFTIESCSLHRFAAFAFASRQVTPVQVVHVEFAVHVWALKALNQLAVNFLLNALGPWGNCVTCKLQILLFYVVERRLRSAIAPVTSVRCKCGKFLPLETYASQ